MSRVPDQRFVSFAQNGEDVVLWRALSQVRDGRYVEVGANHPSESSITRAFYDRAWSGIEIEPVTEWVEIFRRERPRDVVVQAAVTDTGAEAATLHVIEGTGLSTLDPEIAEHHRNSGWKVREETVPARRLDDILAEHLKPEDEIHFLVVDAEGAERAVLASLDLRRWRPWVMVVEATAPNTVQPTHGAWEGLVLEAGYVFCLFDGLSRFYVAEEHAREFGPALSSPSNPMDDFVTHATQQLIEERDTAQAAARSLREERDRLRHELVRWRGAVLARWAQRAHAGGLDGPPGHELIRLRKELAAMQATVSWRVTAPLRAVQSRRLRVWR
jgi:FkbM family methyltransferase